MSLNTSSRAADSNNWISDMVLDNVLLSPIEGVSPQTVPYFKHYSEPHQLLELNCLVHGDDIQHIFPVKIGASKTVVALKKAIKKQRKHGFQLVEANTLDLWKVSIPVDENSEDVGMPDGKPLLLVEKLSTVFPETPVPEHIHIIVMGPASGLPVIPSNVSLRRRTVEGLYDALMEERLIYVRGTPGSGKTTLLDLLHQHILEKDPNAFVCITRSWPPQCLHFLPEQNLDAYSYLHAIIPDFFQRTRPAFLLMDEAQESFGDSYLWNKFLKDIANRSSCYYAVVFCSYGSPSTLGEGCSVGAPTNIAQAACMTLWPRRGGVNGLLLDWDEFNEVVLWFNKELVIDLSLLEKIFELTAGHVGAVCELLRFILDKMKTRIQRDEVITINTYHEEFSLEYIMHHLSEPFARGLPQSTELSNRPDICDMFRHLLKFGRVTGSSNNTAIQYCHRKGWIYAEDHGPFEPGPQYYTFASPLHYLALSWSLSEIANLPCQWWAH